MLEPLIGLGDDWNDESVDDGLGNCVARYESIRDEPMKAEVFDIISLLSLFKLSVDRSNSASSRSASSSVDLL